MMQPDFWSDQDKAKKVCDEIRACRESLKVWDEIRKKGEDIEVFLALAAGEEDPEALEEIRRSLLGLEEGISTLELSILLSGEYDRRNAILSVHAGAGGTDAQDWAEMLLRMYLRWSETHGFKTQLVDISQGEEAGIKSCTVIVGGENSYGLLKAEKGVHRIVRLSPFDAAHRRHTSFALVEVIPEIDEEIDADIRPEDLKIETFRSSGAGGQHVNKTDSAVRITHIPTGVIVCCQNERSQHSNRLTAMKILKARLFERQRQEQAEKIARIKGEHREIAWGNQIRSYVLHPYTLAKDHRTNVEIGNTAGVLDGNLDIFIRKYLEALASGKIVAATG